MVTAKLLCLSIYRRISNDIYTQLAKIDLADPFPYTVEVYVQQGSKNINRIFLQNNYYSWRAATFDTWL